jgi:CHAT domain-containing protein/Flp pilus assembly protein TadD
MQPEYREVEILGRATVLPQTAKVLLSFTLLLMPMMLPEVVTARPNPQPLLVQDDKIPILRLGDKITRELSSKGSHTYLIPLNAGEFLRLSVEQINLDVILVVKSPANQMILEVDNLLPTTEIAAIVAESSGDYRLDVRAKEDTKGKYALSVEAIRAPLEADHTLVAAVKTYREATTLRRQKTAQTIPRAINLYKEALVGFQKLKMDIFEIETLNYLGISYSNLGKKEEAIKYYNLALAILKSIKNEYADAVILTNLGVSHLALGQFQKALDNFQPALEILEKRNDLRYQAYVTGRIAATHQNQGKITVAENFYYQSLALYEQIDEPNEQAGLLLDLGLLHQQTGKTQEALKYYAKALPIFERLNARRELSSLFNNLGIAYTSRGEVNLAIKNYQRALQLKQEVGDQSGEATLLNNLGTAYKECGAYQNALSHYLKALQIHQQVKNRKSEAYTLNNIGVLLSEIGEKKQSISYQEKALAIARELGDKRSEGNTLNSLGAAYRGLGELPKAIEYYEQTLVIRRQLNDTSQEATTLRDLGLVMVLQDRFREAFDLYQQALDIFRKLDHRPHQFTTLLRIGNAQMRLSSLDEAHSAYTEALSIARSIEDKAKEAEGLNRLARLEIMRGNFEQAHPLIEGAIQIIESSRNAITNQQLKAAFSSTSQSYYETYIDLLMQRHKNGGQSQLSPQAFEISEQTRARSLLELIRESNVKISRSIDNDLPESEANLRQRIKDKSEIYIRLLGNNDNEVQKNSLQREIADLSLHYEQTLAEIRGKTPRYSEIIQSLPHSLAEVQQSLLDKDTLLLEFFLGETRSYLWVVSKDSLASFELPPRKEIEAAALQFKEAIQAYQDLPDDIAEKRSARRAAAAQKFPLVAAELSRMLLAPGASLLGNKRLLIVPDGILHYIPFAALADPVKQTNSRQQTAGQMSESNPSRRRTTSDNRQAADKGQPLLMNHEIVTLPSASVLAMIRQETKARPMPPKTVAIFADPVFDEKDARVLEKTGSAGKSAKSTVPKTLSRSALPDPPHQSPAKSLPGTQTPKEDSTNLPDSDIQTILRSALDDRGSFARLHFSREEAKTIHTSVKQPSALLKLDFEANLQAVVTENLGQYQIVHFSTHGILNSEQPELSGLVLSLVDQHGKRRDGFLGLSEIFNLKLPVELVTLSACETALGKSLKGEGLVGVTRGFMYAGAKRVVASLWKVQDYATAKLMQRFYANMLERKMPAAQALREAQIQTLKLHKSPFYWAGFVIQGEWK